MGRDRLQRLLGKLPLITEISLRVPTQAQQAAWTNALRARLPALSVKTWRELEPQTASLIDYGSVGIWIWNSILMIALAFGVTNTLIAAVLERTREIGLLHVLGMPRGSIVGQVVLESVFIIVLGLAVGIALGLGFVYWLRAGIDLSNWAGIDLVGLRSRLMLDMRMGDIANVIAVVLVLGVLGSLYPAWRAVTMEPLDALLGRRE